MNYDESKTIARAILKVNLDCADDRDREVMEQWLDQSDANRMLYIKIIRAESILERVKTENKIIEHTDLEQVILNVSSKLRNNRRVKVKRYGLYSLATAVVASVIILLLVRNGSVMQFEPIVDNKGQIACMDSVTDQQGKVVLELYTGEIIDLGDDAIVDINAICEASSAEEVKWNRITTTNDCKYSFKLSDGTVVWINSGSELRFPSKFSGESREVFLKGEACFEVTHDANKPFFVVADNVKTKVLGTVFNIKAYDNVFTTLIEGKIGVEVLDKNNVLSTATLTPGMQLQWRKSENSFTVERVNAANSVVWIKGDYVFAGENIREVLEVITRMYDVEFKYDSAIPDNMTFEGSISRTETLRYVLETLTLAGGPEFKVENNVIHVK